MTKDELNQALRALARNGRPMDADELTETLYKLIQQPEPKQEPKPAAKKVAAK